MPNGPSDELSFAPGMRFQCRPEQELAFREELDYARDFARRASETLTNNDPYYLAFFGRSSGIPDASKLRLGYRRFVELLNPEQTEYNITIGCDNETRSCRKGTVTAHTNDKKKTINLCDRFFTRKSTDDLVCDPKNKKPLSGYKSRAHTLLHELGHTSFVLGTQLVDKAYGPYNCKQLAKGQYEKRWGSGPHGLLPATDVVLNSDSWAWVATAGYMSEMCQATIPIDSRPHGLHARLNHFGASAADMVRQTVMSIESSHLMPHIRHKVSAY
ncbi:MAG: hypothetical protein M1829_002808 [Trizodia sp. TS-e1964]|nr:MAG: hypothetical protein M1829_002808 [Trizodia sp. TS-e1964]